MADQSKAERLLELAKREPRDEEDEEQRLLDYMEFWILRGPEFGRDPFAQRCAADDFHKPDTWAAWVIRSEDSPVAWKVCVVLVKRLRAESLARLVLSPLLNWALDVAVGIRSEPRKRGRDPYANDFRNLVITVFVAEVRDVGLRPATSNAQESACHLVAERLGLSYENVRGIWLTERKRLSID
ncbi:MAG: hypothetical protein F4107_09550 [Gemmatimonadetes bacterium]|nr:hypothetical protein [Gemmatimonadota bacterium]MXX33809.1 hypothetical protein [Gemmatimonadota bacterium]MYD13297.1 hypothetical protein [Gemmatimonadota bacterium]MYI66161.1 hypothetical protein [Gemmatimonadota bacterium]